MVEIWSIQTHGNASCARPNYFATTTRGIVIGCSFFLLALINFVSHSLLVSTIYNSWKAIFRKFFVYRLILSMSSMAILNMLIHFIMTIPCTIIGCLSWPTWLMQFLTSFYRTMEFGFLITVTFIAVDRFFHFYFQYFGKKFFQKIYTIVILWLLAFLTQFVLFIFGCPKMYNVLTMGVNPCADCKILGVSWNNTARKIVYLLPYPMFVLYFLVILKIVMMRYKVYHAKQAFSKNDQILTIQFFVLCGFQYALSHVENYFDEGPDNYYGLILTGVPILVQIFNALALLLTNRTVRKALMKLIFRKNGDSQPFVIAFGNITSKTTRVNGYKPNREGIKFIRATTAVQMVERMSHRNTNMYKDGSKSWVTKTNI